MTGGQQPARGGPRIAVAGCTGALGRLVVRRVLADASCRLAGGLCSPAGAAAGEDVARIAGLPACGLAVTRDAAALFAAADVVIDFSSPAAAARHAALAAEHGVALVLATTGLDAGTLRDVARAATRAAILRAPNLSPGMAVMLALVRTAAAALDGDYDAEVLGLAHRRKRDAPSGGALEIGRAIAEGRGIDLAGSEIRQRDGDVGPRPAGRIGYASLRGGDGAGEHTALFAGDGERLEITHRVLSRELYAAVAVRAARWLAGRPAGSYRLAQVLGLEH